ncbi:MAG: diaminopimelate epimerase [Bacteroidia bacterium]|nr:diaminopimelate epimerase [Bacteroidia bacterium]
MKLNFDKYQGTGNDFIIVDDRIGVWEAKLDRARIAALCDRRFGIGADGLMLLAQHQDADFRMIYFNSDGNESTMCGNGGRCLVDFAHQQGVIGQIAAFEAIDGMHQAIWSPTVVRLKMMNPRGYRPIDSQQDWIDTGSPHHLVWSDDSLSLIDLQHAGSSIRYSARYAPGGTNVNFIHPISDTALSVRTYERGVEGETFSCGTGVTACAYVHLLKQEVTNGLVQINTPGGELSVEIHHLGQEQEEVWLIGPATFVFSGSIDIL